MSEANVHMDHWEIFCVGGASRDFENTGQALSSHFLKHDYFSYLGEFCKAFFSCEAPEMFFFYTMKLLDFLSLVVSLNLSC